MQLHKYVNSFSHKINAIIGLEIIVIPSDNKNGNLSILISRIIFYPLN